MPKTDSRDRTTGVRPSRAAPGLHRPPLPAEPLLAALKRAAGSAQLCDMAEQGRVMTATLREVKSSGWVQFKTADRICCAIDLHLALIWNQTDLYEGTPQ